MAHLGVDGLVLSGSKPGKGPNPLQLLGFSVRGAFCDNFTNLNGLEAPIVFTFANRPANLYESYKFGNPRPSLRRQKSDLGKRGIFPR